MKTRSFEKLTLSTADTSIAEALYQAFSNDGSVKVGDEAYKVESIGSVLGAGLGQCRAVDAVLVPLSTTWLKRPPMACVYDIDFAAMPAGATHVCLDSPSLWRKAVSGFGFTWDGEAWLRRNMTGETWTPILQSGTVSHRLGDKADLAMLILQLQNAERALLRGVTYSFADTTSPTLHCQWVGRVQRQTFSAENPQHQQIPKAVEPTQWDGEGLPPVGVDCAYGERSLPVRVLAHQDGAEGIRFAVGQHGEFGSLVIAEARFFRPIKTAEQLATEQREAVVQRMGQIVADKLSISGDTVRRMTEALYDSGMRFPEAGK